MKRFLLGSLLAVSLTGPAFAGPEITIVSKSPSGRPCEVTFDEPMLVIAWSRVVAGEMDPDLFMELYKIAVPDPNAWVNARRMIDACMGAGL